MEIVNVLTDTDSKSLKFILTSDPNSETLENKLRDIIFEVIKASEIYERFDSSHKFWDIFRARKERKRKKLQYYEIENIDNPCVLTLVVNPKEYLGLLKDRYLNKKRRDIKKGSSGLGFETFTQRIKSLVNLDTFEKPPHDKKQILRLTVVAGENSEKKKNNVTKSKFSQLNDKRLYFPDGILSSLFHHPN